MRHSKSNQAGFTLLELLLYIGIATMVLVASSLFLAMLLSARVKNQTVNEVEQQGAAVMQYMSDLVRNAEAINSPAGGATAAALTLDVTTAASDPTVFDLSSGALRITEGAAASVSLTSSRVVVSDLMVQNLARSGTPGLVRITFTIAHQNPANRQEYNYSKTFTTTTAVRHP